MNEKRETGKTKIIKMAVCVAAYLLAVTLVFSAIAILCATDTITVNSKEPGVTDLTDFDFDNAVAMLATEYTNSIFMYPGAFYSPQDFADGSVSGEGVLYGNDGTYNQGEYGTLRMVLMLPLGEVYAIAGKNVSYAQRLFIDGKEYPAIGVTGDSIEAVTPKTTRFIEGFQPTGDTTEIIIHYSAFVYADGGGLYPLDIGLVRNIARNEQLRVFYIAAITAVLVTAALFFFGLFLFFPKGRYLLWFAMVCVCVALRGLLTSDKFIMLLLPNLDWYLAIRLEFILTGGMALFSALYLNGLFPRAVNRCAIRGFAGFCVLSMVFLCLMPPVVFSRFTGPFAWVYAVFVSCLLLAVLIAALGQKLTSPLSGAEQILLLFGLIIYVALSAGGIYAHQNSLSLWGLDYPQVGMMVFLFINILALVLGFARTERELDKAQQRERELHEKNSMLDCVYRMKSDLMATISHETRTPLAVLSGYAELISGNMRRKGVDEQTAADLDRIADETERIALIMEDAQKLFRAKDNDARKAQMQLADIINRIARLYAPILERKQTKLNVNIPKDLPPVFANASELTQVLFNLLSNAEKHTENGEVILSAVSGSGCVTVSVADSGTGIPPDFLPHAFERHKHADMDGTGLGLSICKEIIESHGGKITIESELKKGTAVTFILPLDSKGVSGNG